MLSVSTMSMMLAVSSDYSGPLSLRVIKSSMAVQCRFPTMGIMVPIFEA